RRSAPAGAALHTSTCTSGAPRGELVLVAQEIEEVENAGPVAVGIRLTGGKGALEAEEVEEVQLAGLIAIGVAPFAEQVDIRDRRMRIRVHVYGSADALAPADADVGRFDDEAARGDGHLEAAFGRAGNQAVHVDGG